MKKTLLLLFALGYLVPSYSQEVIEYTTEVGEVNNNPIPSSSAKKGEEMEFDWYYKRRSGLQVDRATVRWNNRNVIVTPTKTNRDTSTNQEWWGEIGQRILFSGKARVLGVYIIYKDQQVVEESDNYDITLYRTSDRMPTPTPYATQVFSGDYITTGTEKDSFTYVEFGAGNITDVTYDFVISLALQEVTEFGGKQDVVEVYSSMNGDGNGEKNALVKLTQNSYLANMMTPGETEEWFQLDDLFLDSQGQPFEFDYDYMIIPVMDVDVLSDERVELSGLTYKGHYPNPANNQFTVELDVTSELENVEIEIMTMTGQIVSTQDFGDLTQGSQQIQVDASMLENGQYLYKVSGQNGESVVGKVLISK